MPLRVPIGWAILWNGLFEAAHPTCRESEDILYIHQIDVVTKALTDVFIDLGWYGSGETACFRLRMLRGGWDHELRRFESPDRHAIVAELERWMHAPP